MVGDGFTLTEPKLTADDFADDFGASGTIYPVPTDLTDDGDVETMIDTAADHGDLRYVANIAGMQHIASIPEFQRWAKRTVHSLKPAFRSEKSTLVSDARSGAIRLPLQCLAVYEDDLLAGGFSWTGDEGTNTVTERLERLELDDINQTRCR